MLPSLFRATADAVFGTNERPKAAGREGVREHPADVRPVAEGL